MLNICGFKISRLNENDILALINFGGQDIPWLQIVINQSAAGDGGLGIIRGKIKVGEPE